MKKKTVVKHKHKQYLPYTFFLLLALLFLVVGYLFTFPRKDFKITSLVPPQIIGKYSSSDTLENIKRWTTPMEWSPKYEDTILYHRDGKSYYIRGYSMESSVGTKLENKVDTLFISNERLVVDLALEKWSTDRENIGSDTERTVLAYSRVVNNNLEILKIIEVKDSVGTHFKVFYSNKASN